MGRTVTWWYQCNLMERVRTFRLAGQSLSNEVQLGYVGTESGDYCRVTLHSVVDLHLDRQAERKREREEGST